MNQNNYRIPKNQQEYLENELEYAKQMKQDLIDHKKTTKDNCPVGCLCKIMQEHNDKKIISLEKQLN